ncbi:hypothetical protein ABPG77_009356 [Micractinium sp. CCAP 211/92]
MVADEYAAEMQQQQQHIQPPVTLPHSPPRPAAAHCTEQHGHVLRGMAVLCNSTRLGVSDAREGVEFQRVTQALLHPNSTQVRRAGANTTASSIRPGSLREQLAQTDNSTLAAGDVALLLLDAPLDSALPVAIATTEQWEAIDAPGAELRVVGWGQISEGSSRSHFPRSLQEGTLPYVDPQTCARLYLGTAPIDPELAICAGFTAGAKVLPCHGDSGGPLLYTPHVDDPSTDIQVGIVSGGAGQCAGPALPGVFLRLDHYRDWIESALESVDSTGQLPDGARTPGQLILPATANQTEQQFAAPVPALPLP